MPSIAAAKRALVRQIPCADPLPTHADTPAETILKRVLSVIDLQLPDVTQALFPSAESNLAAAYEANQLEFSASDEVEQPQEFAVNAARGGHTRGQKRQRPMAVVRFPICADFVSSGLIEELVRPVRVAERAMA